MKSSRRPASLPDVTAAAALRSRRAAAAAPQRALAAPVPPGKRAGPGDPFHIKPLAALDGQATP
jgi:hypothetical protein